MHCKQIHRLLLRFISDKCDRCLQNSGICGITPYFLTPPVTSGVDKTTETESKDTFTTASAFYIIIKILFSQTERLSRLFECACICINTLRVCASKCAFGRMCMCVFELFSHLAMQSGHGTQNLIPQGH